jgi:DHA3 family macrolide efflux protein-like MFS transporter
MATQFSINDRKPWKVHFFTIWSGQAISLVGSQLVQFALIWYLTVETGSATVLALASMAGMLPQVLLGPFAGTLVDRWNRRVVMLVADSLIALATVLLAVLFAIDIVAVWHIYLLMFLRSLGGSFHFNAMSASTSLMVPVEHLTRIQGINQMLNGGLNVISAPLGALLLTLLPIQSILLVDVGSALFAIIPLLFIPIPQPERSGEPLDPGAKRETVWQDFKVGLRYVIGWPGLLIIGFMAVLINFVLAPAFSLLPLLVKDYFGGGAIQLGWVESAFGIGVITGGGILGAWGGFKRRILTTFLGLIGIGIGAFMLGLAPSSLLILAIAGSLVIGLMMPMVNGPIFAVMQSTVEPDIQARVMSLLGSVSAGAAPIGLAIAGPVSDLVGIQIWFVISGVICIVLALSGLAIPAVMNIESDRERAMVTAKPEVL